MGKLKRLLFSFFVFLIVFLSFVPYVKAADSTGPWYSQSPFEWYLKVYDERVSPQTEIFGERYTAAQVQWVVYSVPSVLINGMLMGNTQLGACFIGSLSGVVLGQECVDGVKNIFKPFVDMVAQDKDSVNLANKSPDTLLGAVFQDRSLSGVTYFKHAIQKWHLVPEVQAQEGVGFDSFKIIGDLWKITRNLSYLFFVIIAIIFSFMIMFRVKISPQVVISVQSALPKIIMAVILVTFSFAIAGFMVDLMYVFIGIVSIAFASGNLIETPLLFFNFINGQVPIVRDGVFTIFIYSGIYIILFMGAIFMSFIAALASFSTSGSIVSLLLFVFVIILLVILVVNLFKTIFMLYKNLAQVYLAVIIGPLQITMGTIFPGGGIGPWLKGLMSKLLVFPLTGILYFISFKFLIKSVQISSYATITENIAQAYLEQVSIHFFRGFTVGALLDNVTGLGELWAPPMLGNAASSSGIAFILMSLTCIMIIPKIDKAISSFMAGKPFEFESGIGQTAKSVGFMAAGAMQEGTLPKFIGNIKFGDKTLQNYFEKIRGLKNAGKTAENILKSTGR
jgi:hypothetical protein